MGGVLDVIKTFSRECSADSFGPVDAHCGVESYKNVFRAYRSVVMVSRINTRASVSCAVGNACDPKDLGSQPCSSAVSCGAVVDLTLAARRLMQLVAKKPAVAVMYVVGGFTRTYALRVSKLDCQ